MLFSLICCYFVFMAGRLSRDFPDLHDPSPELDGYWPAVAHLVHLAFAILSGLSAAGFGAILLMLMRARHKNRGERRLQP